MGCKGAGERAKGEAEGEKGEGKMKKVEGRRGRVKDTPCIPSDDDTENHGRYATYVAK